MHSTFECRAGCGACCIAPSISSPIPGMPSGKPAGTRCIQLDGNGLCMIFGHPDRPAVCSSLQPEPIMCGENSDQAMQWLRLMDEMTAPN